METIVVALATREEFFAKGFEELFGLKNNDEIRTRFFISGGFGKDKEISAEKAKELSVYKVEDQGSPFDFFSDKRVAHVDEPSVEFFDDKEADTLVNESDVDSYDESDVRDIEIIEKTFIRMDYENLSVKGVSRRDWPKTEIELKRKNGYFTDEEISFILMVFDFKSNKLVYKGDHLLIDSCSYSVVIKTDKIIVRKEVYESTFDKWFGKAIPTIELIDKVRLSLKLERDNSYTLIPPENMFDPWKPSYTHKVKLHALADSVYDLLTKTINPIPITSPIKTFGDVKLRDVIDRIANIVRLPACGLHNAHFINGRVVSINDKEKDISINGLEYVDSIEEGKIDFLFTGACGYLTRKSLAEYQ